MFGSIYDEYMKLKILHNDVTYNVMPDSNGFAKFTINLSLPDKIRLLISNKMPTDTQVDINGAIIKDKYIQIQSAAIDGFNLNHVFLHKKLTLITNKNTHVVSNYFGFNGIVDIRFNETNVFNQVVSLNRDI